MAAKGKYSDIDELFRSGLEGFEAEPSPLVRRSLMRRVETREFLRFNPGRINIWYVAVAAATAGAILILSSGGTGKGDDAISGRAPSDTVSITEIPSTGIPAKIEEPADLQTRAGSTDRQTTVQPGTREESMSLPVRQNEVVKSKLTSSDTLSRAKSDTAGGNLQQVADIQGENLTVSSFTISALSGCAPLKVSLSSTSTNAESIQWVSSDGRKSQEQTIEWEFTTPGSYTIGLTATGKGASSDNRSATIIVHPLPKARFEVTPANREVTDRDIILFNYSENFLTASWSFGDGGNSTLNDPVHNYKASGAYRISLKVTNEHGCSDTVSKIYSTSRGVHRIEFPNAFIPNKNGPTGGYYSLRSDEAASVFHPEYEGVTEYYLAVYSRTGALLFESRSLNIGWDGYYKGQLCEPGVYIWRARGRFVTGEQFQKSGDVTLLKF